MPSALEKEGKVVRGTFFKRDAKDILYQGRGLALSAGTYVDGKV